MSDPRDVLAAWRQAYGEIQLLGEDSDVDPNRWTELCEALADVIDAGLPLVEPGSETRVEWAAQSVWRDGRTRPLWPCVDEGEARRALNDPLTGDMVGRRALSRTIHVGPWQVTDATAEAINGEQT